MINPRTIWAEIEAADPSLIGLPFSIQENGTFEDPMQVLTPTQRSRLLAVIAAHDPTKLPPRELAADFIIAALKAQGKLTATQNVLSAARDLDRFYFERRPTFMENSPKIARLAAAAGWNVKTVFDLAETYQGQA